MDRRLQWEIGKPDHMVARLQAFYQFRAARLGSSPDYHAKTDATIHETGFGTMPLPPCARCRHFWCVANGGAIARRSSSASHGTGGEAFCGTMCREWRLHLSLIPSPKSFLEQLLLLDISLLSVS
uniref:Uncharacterized protein n=1 Tax=Physcomitrium patens TaxID=3218 RepID=A0A2K1J7R3_PHYPA|nr:hypothetical protein PHYPA_020667 [Physcomitrium patens]